MFCSICQKQLKTKTSYNKHLKTKGHLKNVDLKGNIEDLEVEMGPEEGTDKVKVVVEKAPIQPKPSSTPIQQDAVVKKVSVKRTISEGSLDMVEKSIPEVVFPLEGVRYLYHISDIHIHLYKRHEEYQKVFDQLYTELRNRETGIIVVTGDILHNKDVISSEAIHMCQQFLHGLASIMPTVIIAGNHDANLKQVAKLDSLTPTVYNIENLFYLKDTGSYEFGDVCFVVQSVFDSQFIKSEVVETGCQWKVALYHGMVQGCVADNGEQFNSNMSLKLFDGFDAVLLGDIHKHQYLSKNIAYASSLIQQSYGEPIEGHGMIVWDLVENSSEFIPIQNECGFLKLIMQNGELVGCKEGWMDRLPAIIEVKLYFEGGDEADRATLMDELHKRCIVREERQIDLGSHRCIELEEGQKSEQLLDDLTDKELLGAALERYLKAEGREDEVEEMVELCLDLAVGIKEVEQVGVKRWYIKRLEFTNCFCYGEECSIEMGKLPFNSIFGIVGKNGMGKSSFLNVITHGLFGKGTVDRKDIINKRKKEAMIEITLVGDGEIYKVRSDYRKDYRDSQSVRVNFYKIKKDGELEYYVRDEAHSSFSVVQQYFGTYELFTATNIIHQFLNVESICTASDTKLRSIFVGHLRFELVKALCSAAKSKRMESKSAMDGLRKQIESLFVAWGGGTVKKGKLIKESVVDFIREKLNDEIEKRVLKEEELTNKLEGLESRRDEYNLELEHLGELIGEDSDLDIAESELKNSVDELDAMKGEWEDRKNEIAVEDGWIKKERKRFDGAMTSVTKLKKERDSVVVGLDSVEGDVGKLLEEIKKNEEELVNVEKKYTHCIDELGEIREVVETEMSSVNAKEIKLEELVLRSGELKGGMVDIDDDINDRVDKLSSCLGKSQDLVEKQEALCKEWETELNEIDLEQIKGKLKELSGVRDGLMMQRSEINAYICDEGWKERISVLEEKKEGIVNKLEGEEGSDGMVGVGSAQVKLYKLFQNRPKGNMKCKRCVSFIDWGKEVCVEGKKLMGGGVELAIELEKVDCEIEQCRAYGKQLELKEKLKVVEKEIRNNEKKLERYYELDGQLKEGRVRVEKLIRKVEEVREELKYALNDQKRWEQQQNMVKELIEVEKELVEVREWLGSYKKKREQYIALVNQERELKDAVQKISGLCSGGKEQISGLERLSEVDLKIKGEEEFIDLFKKKMLDVEVKRGEMLELEVVIKEQEEEVERMMDKVGHIKKGIAAFERVNKINLELKSIVPVINGLVADRLVVIEERAGYKSKQDDIELKWDEYCKAMESVDMYSRFELIMSEKGLPFYYMLNFVPYVEKEVNRILRLLPNFGMQIKIGHEKKSSDKLFLDVIKNEIQLSCKSLSGSESALVEVALRLAFIKYSQVAGAELLFLDECFSSFDKFNLMNSSRLYDYIRDHLGQCVVITHQESIKGEFDKYTELYRDEEGFTQLCYP